MSEEEIKLVRENINALISEVQRLQIKVAKLEQSNKILQADALRLKTMSDKFLPTIGELMGRNGRKGA